MHNTCRHCGSTKIVPNWPIEVMVNSSSGLCWGRPSVMVHGNPKAWFNKDTVSGDVTANICGECGHMELHASNSPALYDKYVKTRQSQDHRAGAEGESS